MKKIMTKLSSLQYKKRVKKRKMFQSAFYLLSVTGTLRFLFAKEKTFNNVGQNLGIKQPAIRSFTSIRK